jgi:hypothetical protein
MRALLLLGPLVACGPAEAPATDDEDCDGVPTADDCDDRDDDRGLPPTWYADGDGDGFGDAALPQVACARPDGHVADATDCDDDDPDVHPAAPERCGGGDEDCDGLVDDADEGVEGGTTWYTDADGDGVGGEEAGVSCEARGVAQGGDCDDADATVVRDCDTACAHPSVEALAAVASLGVSDLLFDADCFAYLSTVLGPDEVQLIHPSGVEIAAFPSWETITDLPAMALHPGDGAIWVAGVTAYDNAPMVGRVVDGAVEHLAWGTYTAGSAWIGVYGNRNAQSVAHDGTCLFVPNFLGDGTLACVGEEGEVAAFATFEQRVESVAIAPDGTLHASSGSTIWALDAHGAATARWTFDATVLDFAFSPDGAAFVETTADELLHATDAGVALFAAVDYDGKLAVSPDGWLVRLMPYWDGGTADIASLWEEWPL